MLLSVQIGGSDNRFLLGRMATFQIAVTGDRFPLPGWSEVPLHFYFSSCRGLRGRECLQIFHGKFLGYCSIYIILKIPKYFILIPLISQKSQKGQKRLGEFLLAVLFHNFCNFTSRLMTI